VLRVVFTVALAVAVLGVAAPAVEQAGVHRSDAQVRAAAEDLDGAARHLADSNPALPPDGDPARRTITVEFPDGGFASAPLHSFSVGPPPNGSAATRITWRVDGGARHALHLDGIRIRPASGTTFRVGGGEVAFSLELLARNGTRVVRIERQGA